MGPGLNSNHKDLQRVLPRVGSRCSEEGNCCKPGKSSSTESGEGFSHNCSCFHHHSCSSCLGCWGHPHCTCTCTCSCDNSSCSNFCCAGNYCSCFCCDHHSHNNNYHLNNNYNDYNHNYNYNYNHNYNYSYNYNYNDNYNYNYYNYYDNYNYHHDHNNFCSNNSKQCVTRNKISQKNIMRIIRHRAISLVSQCDDDLM